MCEDGILSHYTVPGSITSERLMYHVATDLLPRMNRFPGEHSVLILDNCNKHKTVEFMNMMAQAGVLIKFLPPYSPWLNPIESVFRSVKSWLQRFSLYDSGLGHNMYTLLMMAFYSVSVECCCSFINESGYL